MAAIEESGDLNEYWSIGVVPATGFVGYVCEVYNELPLTFEITDAALAPGEGQWLHSNIYRTITVFATTAEVQEAADRLRRFFDFAHLRG